MASINRQAQLISTCVWDESEHQKEICLNDFCFDSILGQFGFITRHKGEYYFENFKTLKLLSSYEGAKPNFKSDCKGLQVVTDPYDIESFINYIFNNHEGKV